MGIINMANSSLILITFAILIFTAGAAFLILSLIESSGALEESMEVARQRSKAAMESIAALPNSAWKDAMLALAPYSIARSH